MPSINRKQIRPKTVEYKHDNKSAEYYNSCAWHSLRSDYIMKHPLCECCMSHDRVTPAEHVHHKIPFGTGMTDSERMQLLLDDTNLISLCTTCHYAMHEKINKYCMRSCDELTDKEFNDAHHLEI